MREFESFEVECKNCKGYGHMQERGSKGTKDNICISCDGTKKML